MDPGLLLDGEAIEAPLDFCMDCGLISTELVCDFFMHAGYPNPRPGSGDIG